MLVEQPTPRVVVQNEYSALPLVVYPNDILRQKSEPVAENEFGTEELKAIVGKMVATVRKGKGVGLAANQVGIDKRILIINTDEIYVIINPVINYKEGEIIYKEGCLSIPGFMAEVKRADTVKFTYRHEDGEETDATACGLHAVILLHEVDHLDGTLFIDYLPRLKQTKVATKVKLFLRKNRDYGK